MKYQTLLGIFLSILVACSSNLNVKKSTASLEEGNPLSPIPKSPLGIDTALTDLPTPPTSERVQLGRWLFYDKRLSADDTISCATCHRPENGFSEPTAVSTGIRGQKGGRKAPSFVNLAWTLFPHFFWDGRASSLEEQAKGPIENPIEMGHTHEAVVKKISKIKGYEPYFKRAFGSTEVNIDRIAHAIADYERTRLSGNSSWDKWKAGDEGAVSESVKRGDELFFGKARCNQCHLGQNFTDSRFHNLGVGWDAQSKSFKDEGRFKITNERRNKGDFKTPGLREVSKHAPFMHDGSVATLKEVVELYNRGGNPNPWLSPKIDPLQLSESEVSDVVAFLEALEGEGYQDEAPNTFPQ